MKLNHIPYRRLLATLACGAMVLAARLSLAAPPTDPVTVTIAWEKSVRVSRSTPTLQVVVNPLLRRGSPIYDAAWRAVRQMAAEDVRYVPWYPYPKLAVAELEPPTPTGTSWNFTLIDPMTKDFLDATAGHATIMNFSTVPAWLFKTEKPVTYPADPDAVDWRYTQGTELQDDSGKQLGEYYGRLVSWYTRGGFTDERGLRHVSGYHYRFPIWEVLNEVEFEHQTTPKQYTKRYDAIVSAIHAVSPETKFMGLALATPENPAWFEYFLNHKNHRAGIPLDYISYHFYASPKADEGIDDWQYTFFDQANGFLTSVRYVNAIRDRLSPETKIDTDELGVILPGDNEKKADKAGYIASIPSAYWNAAGALYAYLYIGLAREGVDIVGESQMVGYPSQFPSVSMIDWVTGKPNARYWVLKLLKDNFHPGDTLVETRLSSEENVAAQAFLTSTGKRLLLVNRRNRPVEVSLPADIGARSARVIDGSTGESPAAERTVSGGRLTLAPFAVAVVGSE